MTKRQRNILYKKTLNVLSKKFESNLFRVCLIFNNEVNPKYVTDKNGEILSDSDLYPEWWLFKGVTDGEWWEFYKEENANELRAIALQLCIEMTK